MTPIVHPIWIYLMHFCGSVKDLFSVFAFLFIAALIGVTVFRVWAWEKSVEIEAGLKSKEKGSPEGSSFYKNVVKFWRGMLWGAIISLVLAVFIPSKSTIIQMVIAQNITYERVAKLAEFGKDVHETIKKDIIDILQEVTKPEDEPRMP